jgi:hypothetical protein
MKYVVVASLAFSICAALVATACTTNNTVTDTPATDPTPPDESGDDAGGGGDSGKKPAADSGVDSGPTYEQITVGSSTAGQSCDQICKSKGDTCTPTCTFGNTTSAGKIAGQVAYSNTTNSGGSSFTDYDYVALKTCSDVAAASEDHFGDTYKLDFTLGFDPIQCCCLGRAHTTVNGNAAAPTSCDAVCKANGLTCDPDPDHGGGSTSYDCSDLTALQTYVSCGDTPPKDRNSGSATCGLKSFSCKCW